MTIPVFHKQMGLAAKVTQLHSIAFDIRTAVIDCDIKMMDFDQDILETIVKDLQSVLRKGGRNE